jgi:hypothetical protein
MATRKVTLNGQAKWAKVFEANRDMEGFEGAYADHGGAYTINVVLSPDQFTKLKDSRSMLKGTINDEGKNEVKFKRKHEDRFEWASGAPEVTIDGRKWNFEDDGFIPNGSEVKVHISVYDTSRKSIVGTRLEKIEVLEVAAQEEDTPEEEGGFV